MNGLGIIYGLLCPLKKEIVYVGQTTDFLHRRLVQHKSSAFMSATYKMETPVKVWIRELAGQNKVDEILVVVLRDGIPQEDLVNHENYWINRLQERGHLLNKRVDNFISRPAAGNGAYAREYREVTDSYTLRLLLWLKQKFNSKEIGDAIGLSDQTIISAEEGKSTPTVQNLIRKFARKHRSINGVLRPENTPEKVLKKERKYKEYPFQKLQIGECMIIPCSNIKTEQARISCAIKRWKKRSGKVVKFKTKRVPNGIKILRAA